MSDEVLARTREQSEHICVHHQMITVCKVSSLGTAVAKMTLHRHLLQSRTVHLFQPTNYIRLKGLGGIHIDSEQKGG